MRKIILASHGTMAAGLADTLRMIIGDMAEGITVYSLMPGEAADTFAEKLAEEIAESADTEYVILADLYGASVCTALSRLTSYSNVWLFSGMNLSMLLSVCVEYREPLDDSGVREILDAAKAGISNIDLKMTENDEF